MSIDLKLCGSLIDLIPSRKYSLYNGTVDQWMQILALAQLWEFKEIEVLCIRELENLRGTRVMLYLSVVVVLALSCISLYECDSI